MILSHKGLLFIIVILILFFLFLSPLSAGVSVFGKQESSDEALFDRQLDLGEAVIWYLGHSGWAVKTRDHLLLFDYTLSREIPDKPSLSTGHILSSQIKNQDVFVFISHAHGDHFDKGILEWEKSVNRIKYIFGWQVDAGLNSISLDQPRAEMSFGGLKVMTIHHEFDGLLEAAFLVEVDGLVIFHSGDHGTTGETINPLFKDNIDFLSSLVEKVDIAFISQFGSRNGGEVNNGDLYTFEKFKPRVAFPMHQGGRERFYKIFIEEAQEKGVKTRIIAAEMMGDHFIYRKGKVSRKDSEEDSSTQRGIII